MTTLARTDEAATVPRTVTVSEERWRAQLSLTVRTDPTQGTAPELGPLLHAEADRLELAASRFRQDSEISAINRSPGHWVPVSTVLAETLRVALDAAAATDGMTSPCLGRQVDRAGYRAWADADASLKSPVVRSWRGREDRRDDWRRIDLVEEKSARWVRVPPGCELDLGAVAKGWLADRLAAQVLDRYGLDVVANMGGDLRARGCRAPWTVAIDPEAPGLAPLSFDVEDAGLATSSRARRQWRTAHGSAHHIIDPRTGQPAATPWWSVSVLAGSAADANTAATAAMVLGQDAPQWLKKLGLDAWLVTEGDDGAAHPSPSVLVGRWPAAHVATVRQQGAL